MKIVLPQPIADDGRERFGPVAVFVASERATQDRLYAQDVEVVSGDQFVPRGIGLFSSPIEAGPFWFSNNPETLRRLSWKSRKSAYET